MNWADYIQNPKATILKRYAAQLLGERAASHLTILERVGQTIVTDQDLEQFGKFMVDLYELGYLKSVEDHKSALAQMGLKSHIVSPPPAQSGAGSLKQ